MSRRHIWIANSVSALCLLSAARPGGAAFFLPLSAPAPGETNFAYSLATDVSADGSVVVGNDVFACCAGYAFSFAYRWTNDSGRVRLGYLPDDFGLTTAAGISSDGSVVVGRRYAPTPATAYRWASDSGRVGLGYLLGDTSSFASGVSANGSVVVGSSSDGSISKGFLWTGAEGMIGLGDLPGGDVNSQATGVSADGSVVVGWSHSGNEEAFRWTSADRMIGLGDLPGGDIGSAASAASSDGSVIVGWSLASADGAEAFRWTSEEGLIGLGDLSGGVRQSSALDVSADGAAIVGWSFSSTGQEAFVWNATHGMRRLSAVLADLGVDLSGWKLTAATAISADATTLVGYGFNPAGRQEAWLANITVPEPPMASMVGLSVFASLRQRQPLRFGQFRRAAWAQGRSHR